MPSHVNWLRHVHLRIHIPFSFFLHSKFFFLPFGISPRLAAEKREPLKVSLALLALMHSAAHCKSAHKASECMKTLLGPSYRQRTKQSGESIYLTIYNRGGLKIRPWLESAISLWRCFAYRTHEICHTVSEK